MSPTPERIRHPHVTRPGHIRTLLPIREAMMDEYIDELLDERAPLREPLPDEPDEDGFEL